jgi:NitT/TauT family transport system substrate-binding protein
MKRTLLAAVFGALLAGRAAWGAEISVSQWGVSLSGLPYAVALERGLFQKAGIDVTGIIGADGGGGTTVRNVLASDLPFGEVAASAAIAAHQQGLDVVVVATGSHSLVQCVLVVPEASPLHDIHDLVGKKVAITTPRSVSEMVLLMMMGSSGIAHGAIKPVSAGGYGPGLIMLDHGSVDAASLIEPMLDMRPGEYRVIADAHAMLPPVVDHFDITTRAFATAHPAVLRALIAGRRAGVQAIYADPASVEPIAVKYLKLSPEVAHLTVTHMVADGLWSEGGFVPAELDGIVEAMHLTGEVTGAVDWPGFLDPSFLPADLRS